MGLKKNGAIQFEPANACTFKDFYSELGGIQLVRMHLRTDFQTSLLLEYTCTHLE